MALGRMLLNRWFLPILTEGQYSQLNEVAEPSWHGTCNTVCRRERARTMTINRRRVVSGIPLVAIGLSFGVPGVVAVASTPPATPQAPTASKTVSMSRANPAHTGEMPGPGPLSDPHIVWQFETGGVRSSPAVVGGTVFVGALDGALYAIDAATGEEEWQFLAGGYVGSPAVFDDIVLATGDGGLFALDASDGTEIWSAATEGASLFSEATIADSVAYVGGYDGYLYAIDPYLGDLYWEFRTDGRIWIAPAVEDEIVYARSDDGNIYAVDIITGEERWRAQIGWNNESSAPAVADGMVYVGGADGVTYALDAISGEERWQVENNGITDTSPAVVDGVVYIGNTVPRAAGALFALDASTGNEIWRLVVPAGIASSASVTHGVAYFGDWDSVLHAVDTASGEELWQLQIDDGYAASSPAIVDGIIYVGAIGSESSHVFAIGGTPAG